MAGVKRLHEGGRQTAEGKRSPTTPETGNETASDPAFFGDGQEAGKISASVSRAVMHKQGKGFRALFRVQRVRFQRHTEQGAGASNSTRNRKSGIQSTDRFPPTGCGRQDGPLSLGVELDTGVPPFRPVSQPIKCGHGRSVVQKELRSNLACRRVESRRSYPAGQKSSHLSL